MGFYERNILPWVLDFAMRRPALTPQRRELLAGVGGDVLEIGFGSGLNLPFYTSALRSLTAVEPSVGMSKKARRRVEAAGIDVRTVAADASRPLPLADGSFDSVVSTWTLCTLPDVDAALREVYRVLRPGGGFYFVEHGLSPDPNVARWQRRLNPINRRIGGGCNLDRDIASLVRNSPLSVERLDTFYLPHVPRLGGYTYRGHACKA